MSNNLNRIINDNINGEQGENRSFNYRDQNDSLLSLELMLKQYILLNPNSRLPYQLLFRLVWEAEGKILS